ncbi:hypothetical protein TrRE_jg2093, partial [Triparma retinervis]
SPTPSSTSDPSYSYSYSSSYEEPIIVRMLVPVSLTLSGVSAADLPNNFQQEMKRTIAENTAGVEVTDIQNFSVENIYNDPERVRRVLGVVGVEVYFDLNVEESVEDSGAGSGSSAPSAPPSNAVFSSVVSSISTTINSVITPSFLKSAFSLTAVVVDYSSPVGFYTVDASGNASSFISTSSPTSSPTPSPTP